MSPRWDVVSRAALGSTRELVGAGPLINTLAEADRPDGPSRARSARGDVAIFFGDVKRRPLGACHGLVGGARASGTALTVAVMARRGFGAKDYASSTRAARWAQLTLRVVDPGRGRDKPPRPRSGRSRTVLDDRSTFGGVSVVGADGRLAPLDRGDVRRSTLARRGPSRTASPASVHRADDPEPYRVGSRPPRVRGAALRKGTSAPTTCFLIDGAEGLRLDGSRPVRLATSGKDKGDLSPTLSASRRPGRVPESPDGRTRPTRGCAGSAARRHARQEGGRAQFFVGQTFAPTRAPKDKSSRGRLRGEEASTRAASTRRRFFAQIHLNAGRRVSPRATTRRLERMSSDRLLCDAGPTHQICARFPTGEARRGEGKVRRVDVREGTPRPLLARQRAELKFRPRLRERTAARSRSILTLAGSRVAPLYCDPEPLFPNTSHRRDENASRSARRARDEGRPRPVFDGRRLPRRVRLRALCGRQRRPVLLLLARQVSRDSLGSTIVSTPARRGRATSSRKGASRDVNTVHSHTFYIRETVRAIAGERSVHIFIRRGSLLRRRALRGDPSGSTSRTRGSRSPRS